MKINQYIVLMLSTLAIASCARLTPPAPAAHEPSFDFEELGVVPTCTTYTANGSGWWQTFFLNDGSSPYNYQAFKTELPQVKSIHLDPYTINSAGAKTTALPFYYTYFYRPQLTLSGTPEGGGASTQVYINTMALQGLVYRNDLKQFELRVNNTANDYRTIGGGVISPTVTSGNKVVPLTTQRFAPGAVLQVEAYLKNNIRMQDEMVLANYQGQGNLPRKWFRVSMPYQDLVVKVTTQTSLIDAPTTHLLTVPVRGFTNTPDLDHRFLFRNELYYAAPYDAGSGQTLTYGSSAFNTWLNGRKDFVLNWRVYDHYVGKASVDAGNNPININSLKGFKDWNVGSASGNNNANCRSVSAQVYRSDTQVDHIMPAATQGAASLTFPKLSGPSVEKIKLRTITSRDSLVPSSVGTAQVVLKNTGTQVLNFGWRLDHDLVINAGSQPYTIAPGQSRTLTISGPCPSDPATGQPLVDAFTKKLLLFSNDPSQSVSNSGPEHPITVDLTCGATTLYGWTSGANTYGNMDYPASGQAPGFSATSNPLGYFQSRLNPGLVYNNLREVNPSAANPNCQSALTLASNASRCYWADVEPNPAYQANNTIARECAYALATGAAIYVIDNNTYPAVAQIYGDATKALQYGTGVCNNPDLSVTGLKNSQTSYEYQVKHLQGNRTYTVTETGISPNQNSFNDQAAYCAKDMQTKAGIYIIDHNVYPSAATLLTPGTDYTAACDPSSLVVQTLQASDTTFKYTVKHIYGTITFTVTPNALDPDPFVQSPDKQAYSCAMELVGAAGIYVIDHNTYPSASVLAGDATKAETYGTGDCNKPGLSITTVKATTSAFTYQISHADGTRIFTASDQGITSVNRF